MKLLAPETYYLISPKIKKSICNGTGASGTPPLITKFLDNFLGFGTNIREASNIHDYMYFMGDCWYEKICADIVYFFNIIYIYFIQIFQLPAKEFLGGIAVFPLGILRATLNFTAVFLFGWNPFYEGKVKQ